MADIAILRSVGGLVFDATLRESHTLEIELTENPIELGSEVADHMFVKAKRLTIAAGVSDVTLHPTAQDLFQGPSRSQAALQLLESLQESGEPFSIQTGLKLYTNMMCTVIRADQDKDSDGVFLFEADFKEAQIVTTQTVIYPPRLAGKTTRQASPTIQKGKQQGTQVTQPDKNESALNALKNVFFGR